MKAPPFWERINYQFLNLFLVLFFLQAGFMVAANNFPYDTDVLADDLFKNPSRMAKFIIKPPEASRSRRSGGDQGDKKDDAGEMAEKHKGDEGQMGKKDAPKTNARSAPKAIDPNAKELVKRTGLLGVLGRGGRRALHRLRLRRPRRRAEGRGRQHVRRRSSATATASAASASAARARAAAA